MENNFHLLGVSGFDNSMEYNFKKNILVYSIGSLLVFFDLNKDDKKNFKHHKGNIGAIKSSYCGNYIITVDKLISPTIALWSSAKPYKLLFENTIPLSNINNKNEISNIKDIYLDCLNSDSLVMIINVDDKQKLFLFEINNIAGVNINLVYESIIDVDSTCLGLKCLEKDNTFITIEDKIIKIWNLDNVKIQLIKKVVMKNSLCRNSLQVCNYFKVILVLTEIGSALLLDTNVNTLFNININIFTRLYIFRVNFSHK